MNFPPLSLRSRSLRALALLLLAAVAVPAVGAPLDTRLRYRLEAQPDGLVVHGDALLAEEALRSFYHRRMFAPAWLADHRLSKQGRDLVAMIRASEAEGLSPVRYHLQAIESLLERGDTANPEGRQVDLDLLLTDAYLSLASHLLAGQIDPLTIDREWHARRRQADLTERLQTALEQSGVGQSLAALRPEHPGYRRLKAALARYRTLEAEGGWPSVPAGPALKPGESGARVLALRQRLAASGDLPATQPLTDLYDPALKDAVERYQRRHGLEIDGVVGRETLEELNVSAAQRVRQIELNLERWRWLPQDLGARHVRVNIADYSMELWENGKAVATQRVVVGRGYRRTPVFSERMTYLVLNPFWEVPSQIAAKDLLPQIREDRTFLSRMNMQVLRGWGASEQTVEPATVDWTTLSVNNFPYRLRQAPGPANALGQIKFMFPNAFNVYLHDSPARGLFDRHKRAFSSGCIRVQDPVALAEWVLAGSKGWDRASIERVIASGETRTVSLAHPVPVHIQYWTAWVDEDGVMQFRQDLYGRDHRLGAALVGPGAEEA